MNIKEVNELTAYLNTIPEDWESSISIGACFDGYIFVQDYFGDTLNHEKMSEMGYVYIESEKWWALEGEFPA